MQNSHWDLAYFSVSKSSAFGDAWYFFQGHECTWVLYIQRKNPNAKPYSEKRILTVLVLPTTWKRKTAACWKKRVLSPQVPSSSFPGQITIIPVNHPKPEFRRFREEILHHISGKMFALINLKRWPRTWRLGWVSPLSHRSKLQPRICSKSKPSGPAPTPPQPVGRFLGKCFNARFCGVKKQTAGIFGFTVEMPRRWQEQSDLMCFNSIYIYIYIYVSVNPDFL